MAPEEIPDHLRRVEIETDVPKEEEIKRECASWPGVAAVYHPAKNHIRVMPSVCP